MNEIIDVQKWLDTPPDESEVFSLQADGTGRYIPYEIIVEKLYQLCGHDWSCYNLQVTYTNLPNKCTLVSGTIEVEVNYFLVNPLQDKMPSTKLPELMIKRRLAGGANFICNSSKIPHNTAAVKSLAIMSTVKPLGRQFGWLLNEGEESIKPQDFYADSEPKPMMDMIVLKQYQKAILDKDEVTINNIKAQYHVED